MSAKADPTPTVVVLYCQHCVDEEADIAAEVEQAADLDVQPVLLPCSSKVEVPHVLRILERGADGVEVVACNGDGCHFLVGSTRTEKRIAYVRRLLAEARLGAERVGFSRASRLAAGELVDLARARAQAAGKR